MELADDVLKSAIDYLRMTGELSSNKFIIIFRVVNCCVFVLNMVLLLANLPNAKGYMYIKIVESLGTIAHVSLIFQSFDILKYFEKTDAASVEIM